MRKAKAVPPSDGLSHGDITIACRNLGIDLEFCSACCELFYTGSTSFQHTCAGTRQSRQPCNATWNTNLDEAPLNEWFIAWIPYNTGSTWIPCMKLPYPSGKGYYFIYMVPQVAPNFIYAWLPAPFYNEESV